MSVLIACCLPSRMRRGVFPMSVSRAEALLSALDAEFESLQRRSGTEELNALFADLRDLAFLPVFQSAPDEYLPFEGTRAALVTASQACPFEKLWLASKNTPVLSKPVHNKVGAILAPASSTNNTMSGTVGVPGSVP